MRVLKGKSGWITALAFSADGKTLAAGTYCRLDVWDVSAGTVDGLEMVYWGALPGSLQFDPKGRRVLLGVGYNGGVRVIDPRTWKVTETSKFDSNHVTVSPTGLVLAAGGRIGAFGLTAKGLGARKWTKPIGGHRLDGLDFYPNGKQFATVETQHVKGTANELRAVVSVCAAADGKLLKEADSACPKGGLLRVSPDGEWLAFPFTKYLIVHHAVELTRSVKVPNPNKRPITGIAFHPSGRYLAAACGDTTVQMHDRDANWAVTRSFDWEVRGLKSVAFSADGTLGAAGGEKGQVVLWDVDL